ncbi:hypothetical protein D0N42_05355, partial [Micrococcus luteus]
TATRRGCVTRTRPPPRSASRTTSAGGTTVVLPVPGGASTTATPRASSAASRSGRAAANVRPALRRPRAAERTEGMATGSTGVGIGTHCARLRHAVPGLSY